MSKTVTNSKYLCLHENKKNDKPCQNVTDAVETATLPLAKDKNLQV